MATSLPRKKTGKKYIPLLLFLAIILGGTIPSSGSYYTADTATSFDNTGDSIVIIKNMVSKSHKISLYPDASQTVVFFNVMGNEGKVYQLFVFDLEGKIVKQAEIRNRQTTLITDMEKGMYTFEVFSDDNRIGNGQIDVR